MNRNACKRWRAKKAAEFQRLFVLMILNASLARSRHFWSGLSIALLLVASGCSTVAPPPAVVSEIIELPDRSPPIPYPQPLLLETFKWTLMAPGHRRDPDQVYFCLKPPGYEAAARNNGQLLRFTKEVMWQLRYYQGDGAGDGVGRADEGPDQ